MAKVSIIVPVYNTDKYLQRCLDSLVQQTHQDIEIIIVNDGSTDGSQLIIDKFVNNYPKQIISLTQPNSGQSVARNLGLGYVSGDYITFVDSDDWLELEAVKLLLDVAIANNSDITVCDINLYRQEYPEPANFLATFTKNKFQAQKFVWGKLFATSFWQQNEFRFIENIFYEDLELVPKILLSTDKISLCDKFLYNYELRNLTSTTKTKKKSKYIFFIYNNLFEYYKDRFHDKGYEQFLLSMLLSIFLEEFGGEQQVEVYKLFSQCEELIKFSNCNDLNHKFIVLCLKLRLSLQLIYQIVNCRRYFKKIWNKV